MPTTNPWAFWTIKSWQSTNLFGMYDVIFSIMTEWTGLVLYFPDLLVLSLTHFFYHIRTYNLLNKNYLQTAGTLGAHLLKKYSPTEQIFSELRALKSTCVQMSLGNPIADTDTMAGAVIWAGSSAVKRNVYSTLNVWCTSSQCPCSH